jgi:glutaredoxin
MPTTITLVRTPACHFCADARAVLTELGREFAIRVDLVAADSEAGQALIGAHRPAMFPLVLLDGVYFSVGRLPRRKLRAQLTTHLTARPVGSRP